MRLAFPVAEDGSQLVDLLVAAPCARTFNKLSGRSVGGCRLVKLRLQTHANEVLNAAVCLSLKKKKRVKSVGKWMIFFQDYEPL